MEDYNESGKGQKLIRKMESCNKKYRQDERGLINSRAH